MLISLLGGLTTFVLIIAYMRWRMRDEGYKMTTQEDFLWQLWNSDGWTVIDGYPKICRHKKTGVEFQLGGSYLRVYADKQQIETTDTFDGMIQKSLADRNIADKKNKETEALTLAAQRLMEPDQ